MAKKRRVSCATLWCVRLPGDMRRNVSNKFLRAHSQQKHHTAGVVPRRLENKLLRFHTSQGVPTPQLNPEHRLLRFAGTMRNRNAKCLTSMYVGPWTKKKTLCCGPNKVVSRTVHQQEHHGLTVIVTQATGSGSLPSAPGAPLPAKGTPPPSLSPLILWTFRVWMSPSRR